MPGYSRPNFRTLLTLSCLFVATGAPLGMAGQPSPEADTASSSAGGELPAFQDLCFVPFETSKSLPQAGDLRNWFEVIAGQPQGIYESKTSRGQSAGIEGVVRLKPKWPDQGVLRFLLDDYHRLQIHLFQGNRGVTLVYQQDDQYRWTAYTARREAPAVTPSSWTLVGTDGQRNRRTNPKNHGHYELRCVGGEVLLSRGDILLVRAPLPGLPSDVYLQGKALVLGLELARAQGFPEAGQGAAAGRLLRPSELDWTQHLDERAELEQLADGSRRLRAGDRPKSRSWTAAPLPRDVPCEIVLEMDQVSPGAGIYFGNAKDGARHVLRYVQDRRSRLLCVMPRRDDDVHEHEFRGLTESVLPAVEPHHWLRLVVGAGQVRWWVGPDGKYWAEPGEPIRNLAPDVTHFGLHVISRQSNVAATLRQVEIRDLTALAELAPAELRRQAPVQTEPVSVTAWVSGITERTPAGVDVDTWRRACAVRAIAAGSPRPLANELILALLDDGQARNLPLADQLRVLDEAALLIDVWDDQATLQRLVQRYLLAGEVARGEHSGSAFSVVRRSLMAAPIATRHQVEVATADLLRREIAGLATAGSWPRLRQLTRELRFFQLQEKAPLLGWAENLSLRRLPLTADIGLSKQKDEWRELVIEELSKDVYNSLAQLRVELSGAGREDAARVVTSLERQLEPGVAPHPEDHQLLVSLPAAVNEILANDGRLREILVASHGAIAALRLREAIDQRDPGAIAQIAWQFRGTEAASAARVWLGDQALAAGQFALASSHYRRSTQLASPGSAASMSARIRLAEALAGRATGPPVPGSTIELGSMRLPAAEFESLIAELGARQAAEPGGQVVGVGWPVPAAAGAPPATLQVQRTARLEGLVGNDPNREFVRDIAGRRIDWVARQLGIAVERNWMFVCNRFQVAAYDLQAKQRAWQTPQPAGQIQFSRESTGIASRPLLAPDRLWVRLLFGSGGTLACVDRATGQFLWTAAAPPNESFISDPFWLGGELACFQSARTEQQEVLVRLVTVDPRSGNTWRQRELLRLRDAWHRRRCCEVTPLDDGLVVHFGGAIARLDSAGQVLWLRKSTMLPPDEDPQWIWQWFQPPLPAGDHVLVAQPGCRSLDCLDLDTGRVVWSRFSLDVERIVALIEGRLILQATNGLLAVSAQDGNTVWSVELPDLQAGVTVANDGGIVAAQRVAVPADPSRYRPRLVWLDSSSGALRGAVDIPELAEADPRIGPLVLADNRIWTFWGNGPTDPTRDFIALVPEGTADAVAIRSPTGAWERHVDERLVTAMAQVFPQWRLLHAEFGESGGPIAEIHGERGVVGLRFRNTGPIVVGRPFTFPAGSSPRLRLRFGNEPAHPWEIEVRFQGEAVWSESITPQTHSQPWKNFAIDLRQLAGREGWLTVRARVPPGGDAPSYWKSLELVF